MDVETLLREQYPSTFLHPVTCGVEIPPGWLALVSDLCSKLEPIVVAMRARGEDFRVEQLKEKWAGLECYCSGETPAIEALINEARGRSQSLCQSCGRPGERRSAGGWLYVSCSGHSR